MKKLSLSLAAIIILLFAWTAAVYAEEGQAPEIAWSQGPVSIDLENLARIDLPAHYLYANKADSIKLMEYFHNTENSNTVGTIFPENQEENWYIIFENYDIGHIKDSEKDKIDAGKLLKSYKEGTEEDNKKRRKEGLPELTIKGWLEEPKYDSQLHTLVWCLLAESTEGSTINYEARLLCREGYVSATLVCSDTELEAAKPQFYEIIKRFNFNEGKRYEDYVAGKDRLSDLGLTALVVGGTALAVKKGLFIAILIFLKKGGIVLVAAIAGFFGKFFSKFKRKKAVDASTNYYSTDHSDTAYETAASDEEMPVTYVNLKDNAAFNTEAQTESGNSERPVIWIGLNEVPNDNSGGIINKDGAKDENEGEIKNEN
jgi:uncharacterized membrane-anchored protein